MTAPIRQSERFKNLWFGYEVTSFAQDNIESVYIEFPQFRNNTIEIHGVDINLLIDSKAYIFENTGVLTYNIHQVSKLAMYAMFYSIEFGMKLRIAKNNGSIALNNLYIDSLIINALEKIPDKYIEVFDDIPGFENFVGIKTNETQRKFLHELSKNCKKQVNKNIYNQYEQYIKNVPASNISDILDKPTIRFSTKAYNILNEIDNFKNVVLNRLSKIYTTNLINDIDNNIIYFNIEFPSEIINVNKVDVDLIAEIIDNDIRIIVDSEW